MSHIVTLSLLVLIGLTGCVSVPTESVTAPVTADELAQHVTFLTQPALKGRAAGSWESKHVRRYLSQRLSQYGCVPWAGNPSFELDFGFGKNIIAVLPGSDPELSREIVLISAHYDHLKPTWFTYYPGACDNAAAVAVLLEIAEKISQQPLRPKRTLCFAFFDAEEMGCVGSYAFTCRDDYDDAEIVAVINMDMLGRDLLDVVDNSLIATGTDDYAPLQDRIGAACADNGLNFIALESDLIGPVGDHTAFTSDKRPVLFFTCGINKDYHQSTDTADKLNYPKLRREAAVIQRALLALADGDEALYALSPVPVTAAKIEAFATILHQFKEHRDIFKLDPNGIETLNQIIAQTQAADPNTLTRDELIDHQRQSLTKLIGLLKNYNPSLALQSDAFLSISEFYAKHPKGFSDAYRQFIRHYLENKPSLFRNNKFDYDAALPITDADWGIVRTDDGAYLFAALQSRLACSTKLSLMRGFEGSFEFSCRPVECKGSLNEIIDLIFLEMCLKGHDEMQISQTFSFGRSDEMWTPPPTGQDAAQWLSVLKAIKHKYPQEKIHLSLKDYYDPNAPTKSLHAWFLKLAKSDNQYMVLPALKAGFAADIEPIKDLCPDFLKDTAKPDAIRIAAMNRLAEEKTARALNAIIDVLDDETVYEISDYLLIMDPDYPLKNHKIMKDAIPEIAKYYDETEDLTFSQHARKKLKEVTDKDFETDKEAWKAYIDKHY